jgi:hypothetical protein
VKDEELKALQAEKRLLAPQLVYTTMEGHAGRRARFDQVVALIRAEEDRRSSLAGPELVERQLQDSADMVAANLRMAIASESAAKSAAVAAEASRSAARWTLLAALVAAGAVALQVWQAWPTSPRAPAATVGRP